MAFIYSIYHDVNDANTKKFTAVSHLCCIGWQMHKSQAVIQPKKLWEKLFLNKNLVMGGNP